MIDLAFVHFFTHKPDIPTPAPNYKTSLPANILQFNMTYLDSIIPASQSLRPSSPCGNIYNYPIVKLMSNSLKSIIVWLFRFMTTFLLLLLLLAFCGWFPISQFYIFRNYRILIFKQSFKYIFKNISGEINQYHRYLYDG